MKSKNVIIWAVLALVGVFTVGFVADVFMPLVEDALP